MNFLKSLLMVFAIAAIAQADINDGLLNYWNLDGDFNDTAGTLAGNASTFDDNGTQPASSVTFAPAAAGTGQYAQFDGTDQGYIEVPNSADILAAGESLSISAWFKVDAFDKGWQALIAHGEGADYRIARRGGASNNVAYAGGAGDIPTADGIGPDVNDAAWHHVVSISPSGGPAELWVDGVQVATGDNTALTDNGSGRLMIGGNPDTGPGFRTWAGGIDDVGMWNRPLSGPEIQAIFVGGQVGTPLSQVVPEPATGGMLILGVLGFLGLRRRR